MSRRPPSVRWWLDLPIRYKGLLVVSLPLIAVIATIVLRAQINRQQEKTTALLSWAAATRDTTQELLIEVLDLEAAVRGYVVTRDRSLLTRFETARGSLPARLDALSAMVAGTRDEQLYAAASALTNKELALATELVALLDRGASGDDSVVQQDLGQQDQVLYDIRKALTALRRGHDDLVLESQTELERLRNQLRPIILITFVGGLLGALIAGGLFATGIARRVTALERNAERLARGERLVFEPSRGVDEIGSLDKTLRRASLLLRRRDRELRALNRELQRNVHEQALLNQELEAFSYSVSHDLRAPLRSIDGFAQALREDWGDRLDDAAQDHLSRVRNAAQRMGRLIDDLLKLSKLTRAQVERADVDLTRVAQEVCAELTERNPSRHVTWEIAEGMHAWCDPSLARVLLENLLGNAWKFTSKIADARIQFLTMPDTYPTLFVIRDNGAGFDMKYVDKLFAPFQRLHAEREFPGVGIGLATVRRIVHKHGGDVRTQAEPGQGAAFYFTLETAQGSTAVA